MTMITPSYLGETIEYSSLHACRSTLEDPTFPPSIAPDVMAKLKAAGVDATYFEIDSDKGHLASGADWQKWDQVLRDFLNRLE